MSFQAMYRLMSRSANITKATGKRHFLKIQWPKEYIWWYRIMRKAFTENLDDNRDKVNDKDNRIYPFINQIFNNDLIDDGLLNNAWIVTKGVYPCLIYDQDIFTQIKEYSKKDRDYFDKQIEENGDKLWDLSKFEIFPSPLETLEKYSKLDEGKRKVTDYDYLHKNGFRGRANVGLPLFDTTHKYCLMYYCTIPEAVRSKTDKVYVFELDNHKQWKRIKTIDLFQE